MEKTEFLTTKEVAELLGLEVATLHNWRWAGRGPSFVKMGRSIRYPASDLRRWIEERRQAPRS